jgi:hypothetical protein
MHSHQGMQEQSLMTAPLIVRSAEDMRADRQEVVLMLHDFSFRTPEELLAGLTKAGVRARCRRAAWTKPEHDGKHGRHEHGVRHGDGPERHRVRRTSRQ